MCFVEIKRKRTLTYNKRRNIRLKAFINNIFEAEKY